MTLPTTAPAPAGPLSAPRSAAGPLLVLLAATLWGTTGTAASFAPSGASSLSIGAATMGLGGLLTLLLAGRSALAVLRGGGRAAPARALLGGLAVAVYPLAFYTSMAWAGVATGTVVTIGSSPVFAALLERALDGTRLTARWLAATASAGVGCTALVLTGHAGSGDAAGDRPAAGVALGLLAGAAYAVYTCYGSLLIRAGHSSRAAMGAMFGLGAAVLLPVFALTGGALVGEPRGLAVAGYLAVVPMFLAYVAFGAGLARVTPSAATTLSLFEPVVAAALGVVVVGERLGAWAWVGIALVLAGLLILTVRSSPRRPGRRTTTQLRRSGKQSSESGRRSQRKPH
ncbi:EamA family transporter [Streptomyces sp. ODS28]|uniref:DMT family transporter n=1 Tax=Streptomyces sp. ODS28 TaxID=3136688 RepID=UPI0031E6E779